MDDNYLPLRNLQNEYLIDRKVQKRDTFTGVSEQDATIQDSQGPIQDRTREHLGPTDIGVVEFRRLLMGSARALASGEGPRAAAAASRYAVRSGGWVTDPSKDLAAVMTERFGHRHGYVGSQYDVGD